MRESRVKRAYASAVLSTRTSILDRRLSQSFRHGASSRPVEQFDGMDDGNSDCVGKLRHTTDIAAGNDLGIHRLDVRDLALLQLARKARLQNVVHARRAAAHEAVGRLDDLVSCRTEQIY